MISKFYTIYKITHIETGKFYIGRHVTSNLNDGYMGSGKYIRHAIEKHGVEAFTKEYLFIFNDEDLMYAKEAELVTEEFCLREDTYNIAPGGFEGGFRYINSNVMTPEFRSHLGSIGGLVTMSSEHRSLHSKENYQKRAESGKSRLGANSSGFTGKKHSEETRAKLKLARANRELNKVKL